MPEQPEIDTDALRDTIDAEIEKAGGSLLRMTAFATAIIAAITAVVSLHAGSTINEALVRQAEATQLQSRASDQWAYYQAKGIKSAIVASAITTLGGMGRTPSDSMTGQVARYAAEQRAVQVEARRLESERDHRIEDATHLLAQHHHFAYAVALLQVAIALGAVAALSRQRLALGLSLLAGLAGVILAIVAALRG